MKTVKLTEALPETITTQFDFSATYKNVSYTIFNSAFFVNEIYQHFSDRLVSLDGDDLSAALVTLFGIWKASRSDTYARRMYALSVDYDPLQNYDRHEERDGSSETTHGESVTRTHANTDTRTHNDTDTRTHNNTDTTTFAGSETDSHDFNGANSATGVPADTNVHSFTSRTDTDAHTGTIADAHTGTIADAHTGTITDAHSGKDSTEDGYELHAYGNIGVTTSQEMLTSDLALLKHDIALTAVCDFIDRYTYMLESLSL